MYTLIVSDDTRENHWLSFESEEEGRAFLELLPGFYHSVEDGFDSDWIEVSEVPDYVELHFNGNIIPFSRFMFSGSERAEVFISHIPSLSQPNQGLIEGGSLVDAYMVSHTEMGQYITNRESNYSKVKEFLEGMGYEVNRGFQGSEDGEAIIYRTIGEVEWHFLGHMDPRFVDLANEGEDALQEWVRESLT